MCWSSAAARPGLSAALAAGRSGARVVLVEQDSLAGGSLLSEPLAGPFEAWRAGRLGELGALHNVSIRLRTTALGLYDGNTVALVERRGHLRPDPAKGEARQIVVTLRARAIVLATGAAERPLVFTNNDRPGVMLASAVRTYLHRFAVAPTGRAVVATNNDSAYRTAFDLAAAGVAVTLADLRAAPTSARQAEAKQHGIELLTGTAVVDVAGGKAVTHATLAAVDRRRRHADAATAACVGMSGGWSPVLHLTSHTGIKPRYDEAIAAFLPGGFAPGHFGAGALQGRFDIAGAIRQGFEAGAAAAAHAGHGKSVGGVMLPEGVEHRQPPMPMASSRSGRSRTCPRARPSSISRTM